MFPNRTVQIERIMTLRGHLRSLILAPIESTYRWLPIGPQ